MSSDRSFHDLLFELSNEYRYGILLILKDKAKRITELTRDVELTLTEVRRHVSRLSDVGLIQKDVDGYYHLSELGRIVLIEIQEFDFMARNKGYLNSHSLKGLPTEFIKRLGELNNSRYIGNIVDFIQQTENIIAEAQEFTWLLVNQMPIHNLSTIQESLSRGVEFRIIEPKDRVLNPNIDYLTLKETKALDRTRRTPLMEQRMKDEVNICIYLTERKCALSFPTHEGVFDFNGFISEDNVVLNFCRDVFNYYWDTSELRSTTPLRKIERGPISDVKKLGQVIIEGYNDPDTDAQVVQDAVDNYDEVILRGIFNLGTSIITISRSLTIKGEGREENVPITKVYKSGWTYPFFEQLDKKYQNRLFLISGEDVDVTIENIHFRDFEYICIDGRNGNSLTIMNNRITLPTGLGRGRSTPIGNQVIGIMQNSGFPGGVLIEGNYLDFAFSYGPLSRSSRSDDRAENPNYRPDLSKHYSYLGFGIDIFDAQGSVVIQNNIVRNMNARGIVIADNKESADIQIKNNTVISEIYGSYYGPQRFAGYGIKATSGWHVGPAPQIEISGNTINCDKVNYCGIGLTGPELGPVGAERFIDGIVTNNRIHLENGSVGIYAESCEGFEITDNILTGTAYYGIGLFPSTDKKRSEFGAHYNLIKDNRVEEIKIKDPDEYCKSLIDERRYAGSRAGSATAHIWLNTNTKGNEVTIRANETIVDEGEENTIKHITNSSG